MVHVEAKRTCGMPLGWMPEKMTCGCLAGAVARNLVETAADLVAALLAIVTFLIPLMAAAVNTPSYHRNNGS